MAITPRPDDYVGVTVVAAILTWAFSSPDNPHYVILVGILILSLFLLIEARRYRDYDVYRSRVRLFQQNLLADALDPSGVSNTRIGGANSVGIIGHRR